MKANVATLDRALRIGAGLSLIGLAVAGVIGPWGYVGIVPVLTGLLRVCPAYSLLGISSCLGEARSACRHSKQVQHHTDPAIGIQVRRGATRNGQPSSPLSC